MPSGAKKRKAAKKKKSNPHQGENDGGEISSPNPGDASVVKREDGPSEPKSKDGNEEEGDIEVEKVSKSKKSSSSSSSSSDSSDDESHVVEKKVVVLESAPIEPVEVVESLAEEISPIVEPVKPVDSLLEQVSQVFDEMKNEGKKELVVEETPVVEEEQTVDVVAEPVLKENEVEKLVQKASLESRDDYVSSSTPPKDLISDVNGADRANEIETIDHSDRQAPAASTPVAVQHTTSWKSCCGIFELFSGSGR